MKTRIHDIHGWLKDIRSAREMAIRLSQEFEADIPNETLLDALSTAALVRYSRCFTTGIRARLSIEQLPTASEADVEWHERLRGIRDLNIAHPVNQQEVHALYVILDGSPGATTGAIGFSSFSSTQSLHPPEVQPMLQLCDKWEEWLQGQLIQESIPLIPLVNQLSREELLALPPDEPQPSANVRLKRRQRQC